jgi:hypothetical protein
MANGDGFDFGFDPGSFFEGAIATIEAVIVAIINALIFLFNLLVAVFTFLYNIAVAIANVLVSAVKLLVKGIIHVLSDIIHGRFVHLFHDYLDLKAKIKAFLDPVLRVIKKIRDWYRLHILPPLLRTINLIQRIRQFLVVFRLLGFKWASKLDNLLVKFEQRLVHNTLVIQSWLNFAISVLDIIVDPSLIFRKNVLLASLLAFLGAIKRVVFFGANRTASADETKQAKQDSGSLSKGSKLLVSGFSHSAEYSPTVQRILPCIDSALGYYAEPAQNA